MPGKRVPALLDGQAGARTACSRHHSIDVIVVLGMAPIVDDAASVMVRPETFTGGQCGAGAGSGHGVATASYSTLDDYSGERME